MRKTALVFAFCAMLFSSGCVQEQVRGVGNESGNQTTKPQRDPFLENIVLPEGFEIHVFAEDLGNKPRFMLLKDKVVYVTIIGEGRVLALADTDGDKIADKKTTFIDGLHNPHGIDYNGGWFYVAEEDRVIRVKDADGDLAADRETLQVIVENVPSGGGHYTRTVKIRGDRLYLSIGSSCNVCYEKDAWRASIVSCGLDGSNCSVFAKGLRNSVGLAFSPESGELYATENGRDWLGDDLPPEEINIIRKGQDYGWPICYDDRIHDTDFDKNQYIRNPCEDTQTPYVEMQAHSAPLGLSFYQGHQFPEEYEGDIFVAFHGSWNRGEKTGYKVVVVDRDNRSVSDFATGWLMGESYSGRPVDVLVYYDGSLLVSDDYAQKIYRVYYEKPSSGNK